MSEPVAIAASQFAPTLDQRRNLQLLRAHAITARDRGARILVAPEYVSGFARNYGEWMREVAQPLDGAFRTELASIAEEFSLTIIAGMLESLPEGCTANTVIAVRENGELVATYRKVHLYDAFSGRESDWLTAGNPEAQAPVFSAHGFRIGLQTCYDLRFPESSRRLVDAGANLLAVPAEWVRGPLKEHHWRTLLAARAIENTAYLVAADHPAPVGVGASSIIDPRGVTLASLGAETAVAVAWIDPQQLASARAENPALQLRKYGIRANGYANA